MQSKRPNLPGNYPNGHLGVVVITKIVQIGVHNQLTYNSLTKQVTFTPYYVIINEAPYAIECQENGRPADPWTVIEPKSCSGEFKIVNIFKYHTFFG